MDTPYQPGTNVHAKLGGKIAGPFYLVQIAGGVATLQGAETHEVPVSDLCAAPAAPAATPPVKES